MNNIIKSVLKEIVRIVITSFAAYLGLTSAGCINTGDHGNAALICSKWNNSNN